MAHEATSRIFLTQKNTLVGICKSILPILELGRRLGQAAPYSKVVIAQRLVQHAISIHSVTSQHEGCKPESFDVTLWLHIMCSTRRTYTYMYTYMHMYVRTMCTCMHVRIYLLYQQYVPTPLAHSQQCHLTLKDHMIMLLDSWGWDSS